MSQPGRKDLSDKITESVQPQSTKSTGTRVGESMTGTLDSVVGKVQPNDTKSATQRMADGSSGNNHVGSGTHEAGRESIVDKVMHKLIPTSAKSNTGAMGDNIHDKTDNRAAEMQPGSQKSLSSKIGDAVNPNVHTDGYNASGSTNATTSPRAVGEPTMMDKVKHALHMDGPTTHTTNTHSRI